MADWLCRPGAAQEMGLARFTSRATPTDRAGSSVTTDSATVTTCRHRSSTTSNVGISAANPVATAATSASLNPATSHDGTYHISKAAESIAGSGRLHHASTSIPELVCCTEYDCTTSALLFLVSKRSQYLASCHFTD